MKSFCYMRLPLLMSWSKVSSSLKAYVTPLDIGLIILQASVHAGRSIVLYDTFRSLFFLLLCQKNVPVSFNAAICDYLVIVYILLVFCFFNFLYILFWNFSLGWKKDWFPPSFKFCCFVFSSTKIHEHFPMSITILKFWRL